MALEAIAFSAALLAAPVETQAWCDNCLVERAVGGDATVATRTYCGRLRP